MSSKSHYADNDTHSLAFLDGLLDNILFVRERREEGRKGGRGALEFPESK